MRKIGLSKWRKKRKFRGDPSFICPITLVSSGMALLGTWLIEIPHVDYPIEIMFVDEWEKWNTENIDAKVSGIFRTLLVGLKFILKYNKKFKKILN